MDNSLSERIKKLKHDYKRSQDIDLLDSNHQSYKIIVIGDMGVGKTCLIQRLVTNTFKQEHTTTVGVEFVNYGLMIEESEGVKLQVWDTAGQENFRAITRLFYKDSDAIFLLFSITDQTSFDNLTNWNKDVD